MMARACEKFNQFRGGQRRKSEYLQYYTTRTYIQETNASNNQSCIDANWLVGGSPETSNSGGRPEVYGGDPGAGGGGIPID
jgi:hypothetical protein